MRLIALALLVSSPVAFAQSADPTRPPANWVAPTESATQSGDGGSMRLQSVLMPQGGKPVAVISGKTVILGGKVGEATLVRLNEREAVLQGVDGVTHLYLTPDVEKQMIVMPGTRKAGQLKGLP
ncbi:MAG: MSHA biogenesis protein MshK [Betaproteobacteria bacterium]|nr:MSHA biogenesis protein MshK [Betaproteobacteria bacterium]